MTGRRFLQAWHRALALGAALASSSFEVVYGDNPRTTGRAGVALISDDSSAAVMENPAAISRRAAPRVDVAWSQASSHQSQTAADARTIGVAAPSSQLALGLVWGHGHTVVGVATSLATSHQQYPTPDLAQPAPQITRQFFYRYQAFGADRTTTRMQIGVAQRVGDYLAIGASVGVSATDMRQRQFAWAGRPERDLPLASEYDVAVAWHGKSRAVGHAALGLLAATDGPWEFALAAQHDTSSLAEAEVAASPSSTFVTAQETNGTVAVRTDAVTRGVAGARYLGATWSLEANLGWQTAQLTTHRVTGLAVTDELGSAPITEMTPDEMPAALRAGISGDWMAVDGFLWLTSGLHIDGLADAAPTYRGGLGLECLAAPYTLIAGAQISHRARAANAAVVAPFAADIRASAADVTSWQIIAGFMLERAW